MHAQMLSAMLQAALADRCKLVLHHTTVDSPVFELVVASHGPKLATSVPGAKDPGQGVAVGGGGMMIPSGGDIRFFHTSMKSLAEWLTRSSSRPIYDKTGLSGQYDFTLKRREQIAGDPEAPSMFEIGDLGLALKPAKEPMDTLVIDRIERPSPN